MKKSKILSLCLAGALTVGLFAGCAPKSLADAVGDKASGANSGTGTGTETTIDLGKFLTEEGYFKDIKAQDLVDMGVYSGIVVPKSELVVSDEDLNAQLDEFMQAAATNEELKEGEVKSDSTINIDYVGSVDGVEFEGGSTGGAGTSVTIGVTQYIDDFLEQLVGHKVGDKFDINVTFPTDYTNTELAGKDAVFAIVINSLQGAPVVPELTDAFVSENLGEQLGYHTVKDFKDAVTKDIAKLQQETYVWETLLKNVTVKEVPQAIVDFKVADILGYHTKAAQQYGMSLEEYFAANGTTQEEFIKSQDEAIQGQAKSSIVLMAIAEKEGLAITDEDIKEFLGTDDFAEVEKAYGKPYIKFSVMNFKIDAMVQEKAVLEA